MAGIVGEWSARSTSCSRGDVRLAPVSTGPAPLDLRDLCAFEIARILGQDWSDAQFSCINDCDVTHLVPRVLSKLGLVNPTRADQAQRSALLEVLLT